MSKGVMPHNYNLRSRFGLELLLQSDFTPPSFISTPKATASPQSNQLSVTPTTSLLLKTAALYTSPVTLYPPLTTLQTTPTNATSIITTPSPAPGILPVPGFDSTTLTYSTSSLHLQNQSTSDFTPIEYYFQPQSSLGPFHQVQVTPKPNPQKSVFEHKTLPEHFSRSNVHTGSNRFSETGMSSTIKLEVFNGDQSQNPVKLLDRFIQWARFYELSESKISNAFSFQLQGHAIIWYNTLPDNDKNDWHTFVKAFK
ncbi:hypothetical protein ACJMK2_041671 [Sinanodonta woodiana]|uniref:Retrotransposon gag domain-containing protein n=1 Tax=Sinanodonta woodiana TaxID=1069815 RepID=A0ABD3W4Z4_SINWO